MPTLTRMTFGLCALAALGACGATGVGDEMTRGHSGPDLSGIYPIANADPEAVTEKTGLAENETITADSAVTGPWADTGGPTDTIEFRNARITMRDGNDDPVIRLEIDYNGDGRVDGGDDIIVERIVTPEVPFVYETTGRVRRVAGEVDIGGQTATFNRDRWESDSLPQTVIYVPRDQAQEMYAGMIAEEQDTGFGSYAVFGRRTSGAELDRQRQLGGTASYAGIAHAAVDHLDDGGTTADWTDDKSRRGIYVGSASGTIDFSNNNVSIVANMDETTNSSFAPEGGNQIEMRMTGRVDQGGMISGDTRFTGVDVDNTAPEGKFKGSVYGPNAETVGGTFTGYETREMNDSRAHITGGVLMNQTSRTQR